MAVAFVASCAVGSAQEVVGSGSWTRLQVVSQPDAEGQFLTAAFERIASRGIDAKTAGPVFRALNNYIDAQTAQRKTVTLCMGMVVESIEAAVGAGWSSEDTSRFLLALQQELDGSKTPRFDELQAAIQKVRLGGTVDQVLRESGRLSVKQPTRFSTR